MGTPSRRNPGREGRRAPDPRTCVFGSSGLAGLLRFAVAGLRLERSADPGNDPLGEAGLSCAPLEPGHGGGLDVHAQHLPPGPTIRAKGRLKKPIPHPGSSTVIPGRTRGPRSFSGDCRSLRSGLASR